MVDYNRLKSEIEESSAFILKDGQKLRTLKSLADSLKTMDDGFFNEHVNSEKNDFANWISHCFEDELLAQRIRNLKTKQEISEEITTRLEQLRIADSLKTKGTIDTIVETKVKQKIETKIEPVITPTLEPTLEPSLEPTLDASLNSALDSDLEPTLDPKPEPLPEPLPEHIPDQNVELKEEPSLDADLDNSLEPNLDNTIQNTIKPNIETLVAKEIKNINEIKPAENITSTNNTINPITAPKNYESIKLEEVKTEIKLDEIKKIESTKDAPIIINQKVEQLTPKVEELSKPKEESTIQITQPSQVAQKIEKIPKTIEELDAEDKKILETDNKLLMPSQLFKKLKLQRLFGKNEKQETKPVEIKPIVSEIKEKSIESQKQEKVEYNLAGLSEQEKVLLNTENSKLSFKDLFKKLKIQKERKITSSSQVTTETKKDENKLETKSEIKTESSKDKESENKIENNKEIKKIKEAPPVDLLSLTDEEFHTLIGINLTDELIATVSKEHLIAKKQRKKLKTGVPGFDDLVDKGIPEGSSILVSGGAGSGKTTFSIQQLGWAAEHGEKCLFISLEEDEERLVEHMKDYGLNPEKYLRKNLLKIKKLDSFKLARSVEALLAHARGELMIDIEPVLDIIPDGFKPDRVVLDSLSSIAAAFAGRPEEYRIYVEQLFKIFERVGATSFIITEIQGAETSGHGGVEDFLADGVVNFYNMRKGNIRQPAVEIFKMRGTKHKKKIVPFNFVSGKGIEIYPLEEVFHEL